VPGLPTSRPKWPVRVCEAWDGGCVEVDTDEDQQHVVVEVVERGMGSATNRLTVAEVDDLIAALQAARAVIAPPVDPEYVLADYWSEADGGRHYTGTVLRSTLNRPDAWLREHGILRLHDGDQVLRVSSLGQPTVLADPTLPPPHHGRRTGLGSRRTAGQQHTSHRPRDQGHAGLSLIVPVAGLGGGMLLLAAASGKLGYLVDHLPVIPPANGFTLLVLAALLAVLWVAFRRRPEPAVYELADWGDDPDPADSAAAEVFDPFYSVDVDHDPTGWRP
jgi:hypothetical protein